MVLLILLCLGIAAWKHLKQRATKVHPLETPAESPADVASNVVVRNPCFAQPQEYCNIDSDFEFHVYDNVPEFY